MFSIFWQTLDINNSAIHKKPNMIDFNVLLDLYLFVILKADT